MSDNKNGPKAKKGKHNLVLADEYMRLRQARGSQEQVAEALGITMVTLSLRENGHVPIGAEAFAALEALPVKKAKAKK